MSQYRLLNYGDVLPASFLAALQEFIGTSAPNVHLSLANSTTVQILAATASTEVGLGIDGLWRYNTATATTSITGAAGQYDIFATTGPNSFSNSPAPDTDSTNYSFALQALATGSTPALTGSVTNFRKIGEADWDGGKITGLRQLQGLLDARSPATPTAPFPGLTPSRAIAAAGQTAPVATWETSGGTVVASMSATGALTVSDVLTGTSVTLSGSLTAQALSLLGNAVIAGTLSLTGTATLGAGGTVPTVTPATDATTKLANTQFVQQAILIALGGIPGVTKTKRQVHVLSMDDQTAPGTAVAVIGSVPISLALGESAKLIGVKIKCVSTVGGSQSVFKIQTDHGSHGTLADVTLSSGITFQPAPGAYAEIDLTTPLTLADGDEIAVVVTTTGVSKGCKVAIVTEHVS